MNIINAVRAFILKLLHAVFCGITMNLARLPDCVRGIYFAVTNLPTISVTQCRPEITSKC